MERNFEINEKGYNIRCKIYFNNMATIKRVIIFTHGFGGNKDNASAKKIAERALSKYKDVALVSFNWPVHGDDVKKKILMDDCMNYLDLVISYCKNTLKAEKLYSSAVSFGGFMILKYIREKGNPFEKIVLRSAAITMGKALTNRMMKNGDLEKLNKGKDVSVGFEKPIMIDKAFMNQVHKDSPLNYDFIEFAEEILMIHGTADDLISLEAVEKFADDNIIELVLVEGADHRFHDPKKYDVVLKKSFEFYSL